MCVFPGSKGLLNNHNMDNWEVNGGGGGGGSAWVYDESKQIGSN